MAPQDQARNHLTSERKSNLIKGHLRHNSIEENQQELSLDLNLNNEDICENPDGIQLNHDVRKCFDSNVYLCA